MLFLFGQKFFVQIEQLGFEFFVDLLLEADLIFHLVGQVTDALHPLLENGVFFPKFECIAYWHVLAAQLELEQNFFDVLSLRLLAQILLGDIRHKFLLSLTSIVTKRPCKLLWLFFNSSETLLLPEPDNSSESEAEHFLASWGGSLVLLPLKLSVSPVFFFFAACHDSFVLISLCRIPSINQPALARFLCFLSEDELTIVIFFIAAVLWISMIYHISVVFCLEYYIPAFF